MDKKHDHMSEALMRRRHHFASHSARPTAGKETPVAEVADANKGNGEIAPVGAMPQGAAVAGGGDAMTLTPEMLMELLGSSNAPGLRGAVMQNAASMAKKC
jgi:hypothetical protein